MQNQIIINQLTNHEYEECFDLPKLFRIGIFSCSACDAWRELIHSRGFGKSLPRRDFLSDRHQCTRIKCGYGPIRVRIVLKEQSQMANMDPSVIVLRIKRHQKNAKRDAAGRNKVASNIRHELVLANMSSEVSQLASRIAALKKAEKANQIISRFETSKTASMIKDIH
jgi:hypothetical protein